MSVESLVYTHQLEKNIEELDDFYSPFALCIFKVMC